MIKRFGLKVEAIAKRTVGQPARNAFGALVRRSRLTRRLLHHLVAAHPEVATEAVFADISHRAKFNSVKNWPAQVEGFENLTFLFSSSHLNVGIAVLAFDEAAHIFQLARSLDNAMLIEIGRFKGGSTFLLAAAMRPTSVLYSYDWYDAPGGRLRKSSGVRRGQAHGKPHFDADLREALRRYGLDSRVHLLSENSHTARPPGRDCALIFIDGDHSYDGVAADFANWAPSAREGAHILFHDAYPRRYAPSALGVQEFVGVLESDWVEWLDGPMRVGSIAQFTVRKRISAGIARTNP